MVSIDSLQRKMWPKTVHLLETIKTNHRNAMQLGSKLDVLFDVLCFMALSCVTLDVLEQ